MNVASYWWGTNETSKRDAIRKLSVGDPFTVRGKQYKFEGSITTSAKDYDIVKAWNDKGQIVKVKIVD